MGLKARKIKTMIEEHADTLAANFNSNLGTNFNFEYNWEAIPSDVDGWNWNDEDLKTLFYNSYFLPMEMGFKEMFADPMYKEAVNEQITTVRIEPGSSGGVSFDIEGNTLIAKHCMSVNQKTADCNIFFNKSCISSLQKCIDTKLS